MESCCPRGRFTLRLEWSYMSMRRIVVSNSNDESKSCVVAPYSNSTKSLITFVVRGRDFSFDFSLFLPPRASSFDPFPMSPTAGTWFFTLLLILPLLFLLLLPSFFDLLLPPFFCLCPSARTSCFPCLSRWQPQGIRRFLTCRIFFFLCLRGVYLVALMTSWAFTLFPEDVTFFFLAHMEKAILQEVFRADVLSTPPWIFLIRAPILRLSHVLSTIFCTALS